MARLLWVLALPVAVAAACGGEPFDAAGSGGTGGVDAGTGGSSGGCAADEKFCAGKCVKQADPAFGCDAQGCNPCALPHALAACQGGACTVAKCDTDWGDCNGEPGCETDLRRPVSCGDCNTQCQAVCNNGQCAASCGAGQENCSGTCTNTDSDPIHCGGCDKACEPPANSTATCASGNCGFSCKPGYGDCDGQGSNGCETDTQNDVKHCGACTTPCPSPPAGAVGTICNAGQCACAGARVVCQALGGSACVNVNNDPKYCGNCGTECPHGQSCVAKSCAQPQCAVGLTVCSAECVSLKSDPENCGGCGNKCNSGQACVNGSCAAAAACVGNLFACPITATEPAACPDLNWDAANCGSCGKVCAGGEACVSGTCTALAFAAEPWECGTDTACTLPDGYPAKLYCAPSCLP